MHNIFNAILLIMQLGLTTVSEEDSRTEKLIISIRLLVFN